MDPFIPLVVALALIALGGWVAAGTIFWRRRYDLSGWLAAYSALFTASALVTALPLAAGLPEPFDLIVREAAFLFAWRAVAAVAVVVIVFAVRAHASARGVPAQVSHWFFVGVALEATASGLSYVHFAHYWDIPTALLALLYLAGGAAFVRAALWRPEPDRAH